ncbi:MULTISPECIES: hypothetical protein [unclassified Stygiolobus]|uniref:hypothetical protein n=1 Tax=unclassified Stygiolobus TaxID=2824672 RepID=UPI00307E5F6C
MNLDKEFVDILKLVLEVAKIENIRIEGKNRWKEFSENYEESQKSKRKKNYEELLFGNSYKEILKPTYE